MNLFSAGQINVSLLSIILILRTKFPFDQVFTYPYLLLRESLFMYNGIEGNWTCYVFKII